jgi:hypothetical protein
VKNWLIERWENPAKFTATLRTVLAVAGVAVAHVAGAPAWLVAMVPALTQALNAGEMN